MRQSVSSEVWAFMPDEERLQLLSEDNACMDAPQMARHISRIFMSYQYQMLHDATIQMSFVNESLYHALQERIIEAYQKQSNQEGLGEFNGEVTVRMLEVERARPEDQHALLLEARKRIAREFSLPDTLLDPDVER